MIASEYKNIEIRLVLTPEDELFKIFSDYKQKSGLTSNSQVARAGIKSGLEALLKTLPAIHAQEVSN